MSKRYRATNKAKAATSSTSTSGLWGLEQAEHSPNLQALSLFRILFAGYLLVHFWTVLPYYDDFYGPAGILPPAALAGDHNIYGMAILAPLVRWLDAIGLTRIAQIAFPLSLIALAVGYRTRMACGFAFVLYAYLIWRNPYIGTGAEALSRLLLLWCLFLPINRYWSVDAALDRLPRRRPWPALPFVALRLQIASLYFFSGLFKVEGEPWQKGYALIWTFQDNVFATSAGQFFIDHAPLVLVAVNYLTIVFQLAFPYLIYSPWRNDLTRALAIAGSVLMHLSFLIFLKIGGFPYLCLIMLLLLVPDAWIDRVLQRRRERLRNVAIYFEPGCKFCEKVSRLLREFFLAPDAKVRPASADPAMLKLLRRHNSWIVRDAAGKTHLKWRAMAYVLRQRVLTRPLGWLSDLSWLRPALARLYDCIGAHRRELGKITQFFLPFRSDRPPGRPALVLNGTLAALALMCNVVSLNQWTNDRPQRIHTGNAASVANWLGELFAVTQVRQVWTLFAPTPTHWRWSYKFNMVDAAGNRTDVGRLMPFLAPDENGFLRPSHLYWVRYLFRTEEFTEADWAHFSVYICRTLTGAGKTAAAVEMTIARTPVPYPLQGEPASVHHSRSCPAPT